MAGEVDWVAVDWGTSNLRAWGIDAAGEIAFEKASDQGMGKITRHDYPRVLNDLIGNERGSAREVLICGMAGARQGWMEAPYIDTPAALDRLIDGAVRPNAVGIDADVRILPGICQRSPEDVMRGEETQLLGLLALRPGYAGPVIMPGTHSKWVRLEKGRIASFRTAMTGELFDILGAHSVLRHSLNGEQNGPNNDAGRTVGLAAGIAQPELLSSLLFRTRAASLLSERGPDWCAGYLSGLLVGAEVAARRSWFASETPVPLIGSTRLTSLYAAALKQVGTTADIIDSTQATLAGLKAARRQGTK